ncbi:MAG: hypothetical protein KKF41_04715, partial [Actinobacteria bacterium]|nr:hypothetical protein [Actinomycetota bacterium]MBU2686868.1 hypothetical protein [Actinomycetota bacterium]
MAVFNGKTYAGTSSAVGCAVWRRDSSAWTKVSTDGFGDCDNDTARCMAVQGGYLYAGTSNQLTGCEVWRYNGSAWAQVNVDGFGDPGNTVASSMAVFGSNLYVGTSNTATGCEVWRYDGGSWTQVNADGFGDPTNTVAGSMAVFDSNLFTGTSNTATGCEVWRFDGIGFSQVNADGFGDAGNHATSSMAVYQSGLFVGTLNAIAGGEVWRTTGPDEAPFSDWTQVNANGFGSAQNRSVDSMAVFNLRLHAGTTKTSFGAEVWQYDGIAWSQSNTDGFGDVDNLSVRSMVVNGPNLFAGTLNGVTGCEIWRTSIPPPAITSITPATGALGSTVSVSDLAGTGFYGEPRVELINGQATITATDVSVISSTRVTCKLTIPGDVQTGLWDVRVQNPDGQSAQLDDGFRVYDPTPTFYFAEGTCRPDFDPYICVQNPGSSEAAVTITYMKGDGTTSEEQITVGANSRSTVRVKDTLGEADDPAHDFS